MVAEWRYTTISEVADVFDGPHATPTKTTSGPVFLGITSLNKGRIDLSRSEHLSEEDFAKWTRRVTPRTGDVVFSYETKLGEAAIIPSGLRCCLGRRMGLMRPKPAQVDSRFLLYYYLGPEFQEIIRQRTIHGSTVDRLALVDFPNLPLRIPALSEQRAIARVLGSLDDKIELNRRMNATLEAMARALFQSWFVDFDPVRAKAAGRQPMGMDEGTAALFPNSFQESELGEIPQGWRVNSIEEIAERVAMGPFGSNITRDNFVEDGVPVIRGSNLTDGFVDANFVYVTESKAEELRNSMAMRGDIVFTHRGTLGQVGLIYDDATYSRYIVSQSQMLLRVRDDSLCPEIVYQFFRSPMGQQALLANTSQTGVPAIARPTTSLKAIQLIVPPLCISRVFQKMVTPIRRKSTANTKQSRSLATLRDTLLPKLVSGEISVANMLAEVDIA